MKERRKTSRVRIQDVGLASKVKHMLLSLLRAPSSQEWDPVVDLSVGGIRFLTTRELRPEEEILLTLRIDTHLAPIEVEAVVVRVSKQDRRGRRQVGVQFTGYREDALSFVATSELYVLPSLWEGLPYSLLEAMLAAKPVVTTSICSHVVSDGETGLVVPPSDPDALARAMERLLRDPGLGSRMGKLGREKLEKCFSAERMAAETVEVYEDVLSRKAASPL